MGTQEQDTAMYDQSDDNDLLGDIIDEVVSDNYQNQDEDDQAPIDLLQEMLDIRALTANDIYILIRAVANETIRLSV